MVATTTAKRMTYDEWERLPEETGGQRHELIDGVHIAAPSPVPFHDLLFTRLFRGLDRSVERDRLGRVFGSKVDVKLANDVVVVPDLFFVRRERLGIVGPKAIEGAPDLVVEIFSPSTRLDDRSRKLALYQRFGVPEVWFADPDNRVLIVHVLENGRYHVTIYRDGEDARSTIVPGSEVDVTALFAPDLG